MAGKNEGALKKSPTDLPIYGICLRKSLRVYEIPEAITREPKAEPTESGESDSPPDATAAELTAAS